MAVSTANQFRAGSILTGPSLEATTRQTNGFETQAFERIGGKVLPAPLVVSWLLLGAHSSRFYQQLIKSNSKGSDHRSGRGI